MKLKIRIRSLLNSDVNRLFVLDCDINIETPFTQNEKQAAIQCGAQEGIQTVP
jgi:hypothetical protein